MSYDQERKIALSALIAISIIIETISAIIVFNAYGEISFYIWVIGCISANVVFITLVMEQLKSDH